MGGGMPCHHWHSTSAPWRLAAGWARGHRVRSPQGARPRARARCIKLDPAKPAWGEVALLHPSSPGGLAAQPPGSGRRPGIPCYSGSSRPARGSIVARHLLAGGCRCSRPRQPSATPWRLRAATRRWRCVKHVLLHLWPGPCTQRAPEEAGGGLQVIGQ